MKSITKRAVTSVCVVGLLSAPAVAGNTHQPVIKKKNVMEWRGARSGPFYAWSQRRKGQDPSVHAKRRGRAPFRVNGNAYPEALSGGISGTRLVYQVFDLSGYRSDLRLFSLSKRSHRNLPNKVNTGAWEYYPQLSGKWLAFSRWKRAANTRALLLMNLQTGKTRQLAKVSGRAIVEVGQVNGDYLVYTKGSLRNLEVIRYTISTRKRRNFSPGPRLGYAASVARDGTVFLARSGRGCGNNATLERRKGKNKRVLWDAPRGQDIATSNVATNVATRQVLYDRWTCRERTGTDIYSVRGV